MRPPGSGDERAARSAPSRHSGAFGFGDHVPAIDGRHRVRRYWFGGGPIFAPDPSVEYVYGADDYDDGGDPTGCSVFHKAYDSAGRFLGFVLVDLCEGR